MSENGDWMPLKGRGFQLKKTAGPPEATVRIPEEERRFQRRLSAAEFMALGPGVRLLDF